MTNILPTLEETETANVVISDPSTRRKLGAWLYVISVAAGLASMFFLFFPEFGGDVASRLIAFINASISFLSGAFGLAVTLPNIPKTSIKAALATIGRETVIGIPTSPGEVRVVPAAEASSIIKEAIRLAHEEEGPKHARGGQ